MKLNLGVSEFSANITSVSFLFRIKKTDGILNEMFSLTQAFGYRKYEGNVYYWIQISSLVLAI